MNGCWYILGFAVLVALCAAFEDYDGYSWEDFEGNVPKTCVSGGKTSQKKKLCIARAPYTNGSVVPGWINGDGALIYVDGRVEFKTKDVEILVSKKHDNFDWFQTDGTKVRLICDQKFVRGGYDKGGRDNGYPLLVGRKIANDGLFPGSVGIDRDNKGINFAISKSQGRNKMSDFEVLTYSKC